MFYVNTVVARKLLCLSSHPQMHHVALVYGIPLSPPTTVTSRGPFHFYSFRTHRDGLGVNCASVSLPPKHNFLILSPSFLFLRLLLIGFQDREIVVMLHSTVIIVVIT